MKIYKLILLTFFLSSLSCKLSNDVTNNEISSPTALESKNEPDYNESLSKWNALKNINGDSYTYITSFISWVGFGHTTEIKVENGVVTSRIYKEFNLDRETIESYHETQNDLGSYDKGSQPLSIDELYNICVKKYLSVDEENNTVYFKTAENGLMTLCGYAPKMCADDCYRGIRIDSFVWIN